MSFVGFKKDFVDIVGNFEEMIVGFIVVFVGEDKVVFVVLGMSLDSVLVWFCMNFI